MKALVCTNQLCDLTGSEVLALEVCDVLFNMGYQVDLYANHVQGDSVLLADVRARVTSDPSQIKIRSYDFIWTQHGSLGFFDLNLLGSDTKVVSAHLSPFEDFEHVGLLNAALHEFYIFCNSGETRHKISTMGISEEFLVDFKNACPAFYNEEHAMPEDFRSIAVVSNHIPPELLEAVELLRSSGVTVDIYGKDFEVSRVTPSTIRRYSAIVSIGKSVQLSLIAGVPVYCYDHFGGPGWLNSQNFEKSEFFNFSGRCCGSKREPYEICVDLISNFESARLFATEIQGYATKTYDLSQYIAGVVGGSYAPVHPDGVDLSKLAKHASQAQSKIIRRLSAVAYSKIA